MNVITEKNLRILQAIVSLLTIVVMYLTINQMLKERKQEQD